MTTATIITVNGQTAGVLMTRDDSRGHVFHTSDVAFKVLDGSTFANRHAAQRAAERIGSVVHGQFLGRLGADEGQEIRDIRNSRV